MSARKRGAGRPGALDEARALVTLVEAALARTGGVAEPLFVQKLFQRF